MGEKLGFVGREEKGEVEDKGGSGVGRLIRLIREGR